MTYKHSSPKQAESNLIDTSILNNSFEVPKENEVYLGAASNSSRSSLVTSTTSPCSSPAKRMCSSTNVKPHSNLFEKKRKKVSFVKVEIIPVESLKKYNFSLLSEKEREKGNACACMIF